MEPELEQKVRERIQELPETIRLAIQDSELQKKIQALGEKHKLHLDQVGELEGHVLMVMMGFSSPAVFEQEIANSLHLAPEASKALVADINEGIFLPIQDAMKQFMERGRSKPELQPANSLLENRTVSKLPQVPPSVDKPIEYKTDPYREPPTP